MKNKMILTVAIIVASTFAFMFGISEYSNNSLRRQIHERDMYLDYMDSILVSYGYISHSDSSTMFIRLLDTYGNVMNLSQVDSVQSELERIIKIQDLIIKSAKRTYNFNYSYTIRGDSVIMKFWNKPKSN